MGTRYSHFTLDERCRLRGLMEMGLGPGEIARRLGRHRGTIYREIARNRCALSIDLTAPIGSPGFANCAARRSSAPPAFAIMSETALPWDGRRKRSPGGWSWTQ